MRFSFPSAGRCLEHLRAPVGSASGRFRKLIAQPRVEGLESRRLLSVAFHEYPLAGGAAQAGIVSGPDGNLWFTEYLAGKIDEIDPTTHAITSFPVPTAAGEPLEITKGPDSDLWFTERDGNNIGRINPATHAVDEFPIPTPDSGPEGIAVGPDGNLWFTESNANQIGEIDPTTLHITEFPTIGTECTPSEITMGPDGNLWFTEDNRNAIGRINPTTGTVTDFPISTNNLMPSPADDITKGPDGNLWFTEHSTDQVGRIDPTSGSVVNYPIPTAGSSPSGIVAGPDGNLWFVENSGNKVGRIDPATGAITEFVIPTPGVHPAEITVGPDGNLWFTEEGYSDEMLPNYPSFSNIGQVVVGAAGAPDLSLTGTAPQSSALGDNVTFSLTVTNDGSGVATGVKLTNVLPAGVPFVSATGGITPVAGGLSFTISDLPSGASTSISIVVAPKLTGEITDSAQVTMVQYDPTPIDNNVTLTTNVFTYSADLALSGTAPNAVAANALFTYNLTVKNEGQTEATNVTLTDIIPSYGTFVSATGGVTPDSNGNLIFALGNLAPSASTSVAIVFKSPTYTPKQGLGLVDYATVSMDQPDPTPADNSLSFLSGEINFVGTGCQGQTTAFVLSFAEPVDPAWAENINNYQLVDLQGSRRRVLLKSVKFDRATDTVTFKALHQQNMHRLYQLTVIGAGAGGHDAAATGPADAQSRAGDAGGNLVILIGIADLANRGKSPAALRNYKSILHAQRLEMKRLGLD